jgi:hypothetical protein
MRHWLLSIDIGGRVYRYTTAPDRVTVTDTRSGTVYAFDPGLSDPAPTLSTASVEGIEIPVEVLLSPEGWRALKALRDKGGLSAELSLWQEGDSWAEREVWADGRADSPVHETIGDPLKFSIIEVPWEDRTQIPGPSQLVNAATWPVRSGTIPDDNVTGQYYPYIFGSPGVVRSDDSFTDYYGWPVLLVEIDSTTEDNFTGGAVDARIVLAGHPMVAANVVLYNRTTGLKASVATAQSVDLLGQVVTVATVAGGTLQITSGDELWAGCADATQGGIVNPSGAVLRGAGEIIRWLIEASTVRYDLTRFPMLTRLDAFKLDFFINTPTTMWGVLTDTILGSAGDLLPCYWQRASGGLYLAVWPWETASQSPSAPAIQIDPTTRGGSRSGPVTDSTGADLRTDMILSYAKDEANNNLRRVLSYAPIPTPGAIVNPYLAARYARIAESKGAYERGKIRQTETIECSCVQDPTTARLLLDLAAVLRSTTRASVRYLLPPDPRLVPGATAIVTDDDPYDGIGWTAVRCRIVSVTRPAEDAWWQVDLEELPDWLRITGGPVA